MGQDIQSSTWSALSNPFSYSYDTALWYPLLPRMSSLSCKIKKLMQIVVISSIPGFLETVCIAEL